MAESPVSAPQANGTTAVTARPKTSRRPASFSGTPSGAAQPADWVALAPHTELPNVTELAPAKSWQDDPRFAISLVLLITLVNLVVSFWLSAITPSAPATESHIEASPANAPSSDADVHLLDTTSEQ